MGGVARQDRVREPQRLSRTLARREKRVDRRPRRGVQADEKLPRASDPPASGEKFGGYNPRGRRSGGSDRLEAGVAGTLRGVFAPDSARGGNLGGPRFDRKHPAEG